MAITLLMGAHTHPCVHVSWVSSITVSSGSSTMQDTLRPCSACRYKWLLHTAGNTYSARLKYLLFCKSAVVLPDSPWQEFFYHMLQPGHNVYRIDALTYGNRAYHLPAVADYLQENDAEAERIGAAGAAFARKYLSSQSVEQYYKELIETYAGLMKFKPKVHPDAIPIDKSLMNDYARPFQDRTCEVCRRT